MIESLGSSITDYARQERELAYSRENSVRSAETKEAGASGDVAAITESQQQISDTAEVKTRPPQYDTIEISEEGMAQSLQKNASQVETIQTAASDLSTSAAGETDEADETTTTPVLSSYTEDELNDLVDEGSITAIQKNTELARRAAEVAAAEAAQATKSDSSSGAVTGEEMALNRSQLAAGAADE
ncbi:hypothetical protein Ami103574_14915 [Aminipila butyrica]|uniref:Uncharacterized protein n=1 Tax=Aminipila butyrica TaxID=433296 RepID=A0A858BYH2_9FIRM|nr:hypothetical protein [Aminipila butyrica]QIB70502.1 hypothetical protein Ami103574_14915 [Aminipila butyrica]